MSERSIARALAAAFRIVGCVVLLSISAGSAMAAETVVVMLDQAKIVRLPDKVQTVVVGNPGIADVTVQKNGILVVTGKSYGVTNLIALDTGGNMLAESMIRVEAPTESVVIVQRGLERESYSCAPTCQPSIQLGDDKAFFSDIGGQTGQRNSIAGGGGGAAAPAK